VVVINIFNKYAKHLEHGKMGCMAFNKMPMCKNSHDMGIYEKLVIFMFIFEQMKIHTPIIGKQAHHECTTKDI
jgi:hypothetical protein